MRLTLHTDYALRVLIFVGLKSNALATIPEIVANFGMSNGHVMKVVHRLARLGYLHTVRGRNGGMRLARSPAAIGVGAVVRATEQELDVLGCLPNEKGYCRIEECCTLRRALREATDAFIGVLDRYTLADLLEPRARLAGLLQIGDAAGHAAQPSI